MSDFLYDEPPLIVSPSLAVLVGLNEAIILQQLHYWQNNPNVGVDIDGRKWVYNTQDDWCANFPFWSKSTIKRSFTSLIKKGLVDTQKHKEKDYNQTNYYAINHANFEALKVVKNSEPVHKVKMNQSSGSNCTNQLGQNEPIYTETTSETTSNKNSPKSPQGDIDDISLCDVEEKTQADSVEQNTSEGVNGRYPKEFASLIPIYPKPDGIHQAFAIWSNMSKKDHVDFAKAVANYARKCEAEKTEHKFVKKLSSFIGVKTKPWLDFVEYETPEERELRLSVQKFRKDLKGWSVDRWVNHIKRAVADNDKWNTRYFGPPPGREGTLCPISVDELREKYKLDVV